MKTTDVILQHLYDQQNAAVRKLQALKRYGNFAWHDLGKQITGMAWQVTVLKILEKVKIVKGLGVESLVTIGLFVREVFSESSIKSGGASPSPRAGEGLHPH